MNNIEAGRCLLCKAPRCSAACAVKTDVPAAMKLYREGKYGEAASMLYTNNPFSAITSLICDWQKNCLGHCVLNAKKAPVRWHEIEAELSCSYIFDAHAKAGADNGKKVAVIGAGPAGITAALILREKGCSVTIYDRNARPGGVLRYGIPEFRLDRRYIGQYDRLLEEAGIEFRGSTDIGGKDGISLEHLAAESDAVLIAGGAAIPRRLDIPGEDNPDIIYALDYLKNPGAYGLGHKVLVIGGGNVTMDACRTAIRLGHDTHVYYRKSFENMPANSIEVKEAVKEGVQFHLFEVPVAVRGHKAVMRKCENVTGPDGKVSTKMIDGTDHEVEFDSMLVAISASVDCSIFGAGTDVELAHGRPVTDEMQQTSVPGVFAAGDFLLGPATVVEAVASARTAAYGILEHIGICAD